MAGVFSLGIATLDYVYSVETMPTRGEKYRSRDLAVVGGGCAGNASVAIARLGGRSWLATRLADDRVGDEIVAELGGEGVDTRFALRAVGLRSPVSAILVDAAGERMVVSYSDPAMPESADWLPKTLPDGAKAVLADTRWGEGALAALTLARQAGVPGLLDGDRRPPHPDLVATASHVAFSAQALREVSGEEDPRLGLARIAQGTATWLAVTLGKEGCSSSKMAKSRMCRPSRSRPSTRLAQATSGMGPLRWRWPRNRTSAAPSASPRRPLRSNARALVVAPARRRAAR